MKISEEKKNKISEQIITFLFGAYPKSFFTSYIAKELARDEEFIKKILLFLKKKGILLEIKKNPKGAIYLKRSRWKLTNQLYNLYKQRQ
jgi:hypothetical protein